MVQYNLEITLRCSGYTIIDNYLERAKNGALRVRQIIFSACVSSNVAQQSAKTTASSPIATSGHHSAVSQKEVGVKREESRYLAAPT